MRGAVFKLRFVVLRPVVQGSVTFFGRGDSSNDRQGFGDTALSNFVVAGDLCGSFCLACNHFFLSAAPEHGVWNIPFSTSTTTPGQPAPYNQTIAIAVHFLAFSVIFVYVDGEGI
jgi:hypothetical protein